MTGTFSDALLLQAIVAEYDIIVMIPREDNSKNLGAVLGMIVGLVLLAVVLFLLICEVRCLKEGKIWSLDKHHFGPEYDFIFRSEKPLTFWAVTVGSILIITSLGVVAIWLLRDSLVELVQKLKKPSGQIPAKGLGSHNPDSES